MSFTGYLRGTKARMVKLFHLQRCLGLIFEELMTSPARPELARYPWSGNPFGFKPRSLLDSLQEKPQTIPFTVSKQGKKNVPRGLDVRHYL